MRNQSQLVVGVIILLLGLIFLIGNLFNINVWAFIWPFILIVLGLWLLFRPRLVSTGTAINFHPLGDVQRRGTWSVADEEIWMFVGDITLDFTNATLPPGETKLRVIGFVTDIDVFLPAEVGLSISSTAFLTDAKVFGEKNERFLIPVNVVSDNYEAAERKIHLETVLFVADLTAERM